MNSDPQAAPKKPKKPYHQPSLKVYGNIQALTATTGGASVTDDGGSGAMAKTH